MKTHPEILALASVLILAPLVTQCTDDTSLQPERLAPPQRLDNRIGPPNGRWFSDYMPLSVQRQGIRWYFWLDSEEWTVSRVTGTETIPYLNGAVQATMFDSEGARYGFVEHDNEFWYLAVRGNDGDLYYLSTDCALTAYPPDKAFGRVQDGTFIDASSAAYYVSKDLEECVPVTGFGPEEAGQMLVKESDVNLLGQRYNNALVLWGVEPSQPFHEVSFWGYLGDAFGIRRPTATETGGRAVDSFMILALQKGIVVLGDLDVSTGRVEDIAMLLGDFRSAATPVHRLTGGGTIDWSEEVKVRYGFAATLDASGEAHGVLQFYYKEVPYLWHGAIDCLNVTGNRAYASGVFTGGTNVGQYFFFGVEDNGEGAGASGPDLISLIYYSDTPKDCHVDMPDPYQGWTNGNVQIRYLAGDLWNVE